MASLFKSLFNAAAQYYNNTKRSKKRITAANKFWSDREAANRPCSHRVEQPPTVEEKYQWLPL